MDQGRIGRYLYSKSAKFRRDVIDLAAAVLILHQPPRERFRVRQRCEDADAAGHLIFPDTAVKEGLRPAETKSAEGSENCDSGPASIMEWRNWKLSPHSNLEALSTAASGDR